MKSSLLVGAALFALTCTIPSLGLSQEWPNWRGPNFDGSSPATKLPSSLRKEKAAWTTALPGEGASTPILHNGALYLTSVDESKEGIVGMKIDPGSGEILWSTLLSTGIRENDRSTFSASSAVADGERIIFLTGKGDLAAFHPSSGEELWRKDLQAVYGPFALLWTYGASPLLHDGRLIVPLLQRDEPVNGKGRPAGESHCMIIALDPASGEEIWTHRRDNDAVKESREAFTTPLPVTLEGRASIVIAGSDCVTGHDPVTGAEQWRWGTYNPERISHWRLVTSPTYGEGTILVCAPKGAPVYAIPANQSGTLSADEALWASSGKVVTSDVPAPAYSDGFFYILNGRNKFLSCVHPKTGEVQWEVEVPAKTKLEASPTVADGKIYVISHMGEAFVFSAGKEGGQLLSESMLASMQSTMIRASIVPTAQGIFVRTDKELLKF